MLFIQRLFGGGGGGGGEGEKDPKLGKKL